MSVLTTDKRLWLLRWYKLLELAPWTGSKVRMWMSTAFKVDCDDRWSPKAIYKDVISNAAMFRRLPKGRHEFGICAEDFDSELEIKRFVAVQSD